VDLIEKTEFAKACEPGIGTWGTHLESLTVLVGSPSVENLTSYTSEHKKSHKRCIDQSSQFLTTLDALRDLPSDENRKGPGGLFETKAQTGEPFEVAEVKPTSSQKIR
jgi:hypothetical protein